MRMSGGGALPMTGHPASRAPGAGALGSGTGQCAGDGQDEQARGQFRAVPGAERPVTGISPQPLPCSRRWSAPPVCRPPGRTDRRAPRSYGHSPGSWEAPGGGRIRAIPPARRTTPGPRLLWPTARGQFAGLARLGGCAQSAPPSPSGTAGPPPGGTVRRSPTSGKRRRTTDGGGPAVERLPSVARRPDKQTTPAGKPEVRARRAERSEEAPRRRSRRDAPVAARSHWLLANCGGASPRDRALAPRAGWLGWRPCPRTAPGGLEPFVHGERVTPAPTPARHSAALWSGPAPGWGWRRRRRSEHPTGFPRRSRPRPPAVPASAGRRPLPALRCALARLRSSCHERLLPLEATAAVTRRCPAGAVGAARATEIAAWRRAGSHAGSAGQGALAPLGAVRP